MTRTPDHSDKPPFFRSWNGLYAFVLGVLVFLIALFTYLTAHYA